jgi:hypothetical protein
MGAADPTKDIIMATNDDPEFEPVHSSSPTDHVLTELQLHGHRPFEDEPDPRPLPEANAITGAVVDIFDALVSTLTDTRLEPDLEDLLWSTVNLFHRAVDRIERELDGNERNQQRSQREQNGSEVRSVELERLVAEGLTLIERRNAMELSATRPPSASRPTPARPGGRAPDRWSITGLSPPRCSTAGISWPPGAGSTPSCWCPSVPRSPSPAVSIATTIS